MLAPERICVPVPIFFSSMPWTPSWMTPSRWSRSFGADGEQRLEVVALLTLPPPSRVGSQPITALPLMSRVAPAATLKAEALEKPCADPASRMPALTMVSPVSVLGR